MKINIFISDLTHRVTTLHLIHLKYAQYSNIKLCKLKYYLCFTLM